MNLTNSISFFFSFYIFNVAVAALRMYAPHVFCFLRRFCAVQGANARACTGYLSFHTLASKNGNQYLGFSKTYFSLQMYMGFGDTKQNFLFV